MGISISAITEIGIQIVKLAMLIFIGMGLGSFLTKYKEYQLPHEFKSLKMISTNLVSRVKHHEMTGEYKDLLVEINKLIIEFQKQSMKESQTISESPYTDIVDFLQASAKKLYSGKSLSEDEMKILRYIGLFGTLYR